MVVSTPVIFSCENCYALGSPSKLLDFNVEVELLEKNYQENTKCKFGVFSFIPTNYINILDMYSGLFSKLVVYLKVWLYQTTFIEFLRITLHQIPGYNGTNID